MADRGAHIQSADVLQEVKTACALFLDRAESALGELRMRIDRMLSWIETERPAYWANQERIAYDRVGAARASLEMCQVRTINGHVPECIEQKVALRRAKERLEFCHAQRERVRHWAHQCQRHAEDFRSRTSGMSRMLESTLPEHLAELERQIAAIANYLGNVAAEEVLPDAVAELPQPLVSGFARPIAAQAGSPNSTSAGTSGLGESGPTASAEGLVPGDGTRAEDSVSSRARGS